HARREAASIGFSAQSCHGLRGSRRADFPVRRDLRTDLTQGRFRRQVVKVVVAGRKPARLRVGLNSWSDYGTCSTSIRLRSLTPSSSRVAFPYRSRFDLTSGALASARCRSSSCKESTSRATGSLLKRSSFRVAE